MVRQGQERQVRTPLYLRLGEWRTTVQAYFPWMPCRDSSDTDTDADTGARARRQAAAPCQAPPPCDEGGWISVPLSAQAEFALAAQIKTAFGLPITAGSTVVGVRQAHYAPLTPLCMLPRLPAQCLNQELEVVLAPASQRLEMQPLPVLELDASVVLSCAARLRAGSMDSGDTALAQLVCSGLSIRGILRMVLAPAQLAKISRATVAFDKFCCETGHADKRRHVLNLCGEGSGKWIGYTRQPRREFFQVRKTGQLLGLSKIYDHLARETWLAGTLQDCSEIDLLRKLKGQLLRSGGCKSTIARVDERLTSLVADQVAALAVSELRVWLQGNSAVDNVSAARSDQVDEVSKMLGTRLSTGVRRCGILKDSDLNHLRMALISSAAAGSTPQGTGSTGSSTDRNTASERCRAVLYGAATDVVRRHFSSLSTSAGDLQSATDRLEVDIVGWVQRFRDACESSADPDIAADIAEDDVERDPTASKSSTGTHAPGNLKHAQLRPDKTQSSITGSSRVYGSDEFADAASDMFDMLHELSVALLHVLAAGLGLEASAVSVLCDTPTPGPTEFSSSVLRLYRYFGGSRPEAACGVHADIGLLTLSPRADIPGLTVLDGTEHAWVDAEDGVEAKVCTPSLSVCLSLSLTLSVTGMLGLRGRVPWSVVKRPFPGTAALCQ